MIFHSKNLIAHCPQESRQTLIDIHGLRFPILILYVFMSQISQFEFKPEHFKPELVIGLFYPLSSASGRYSGLIEGLALLFADTTNSFISMTCYGCLFLLLFVAHVELITFGDSYLHQKRLQRRKIRCSKHSDCQRNKK